MKQPVPELSEADLTRVVHREFADPAPAIRLLTVDYEKLTLRAKVAAVKISAGSTEALRGSLKQAQLDERDVIAWAEYHRFMAISVNTSGPIRDQAIAFDWGEYSSWLSFEIEFRWKEEVVYWEGSKGCVFPGAWGRDVPITIVPDETSWDRVVPNWMTGRRAEVVGRLAADTRHQVFGETAGEKALDVERRQGQ